MAKAPNHVAADTKSGDGCDESGQPAAMPTATLAALAGEINALLAAARPRLVQLARLNGLAPDAANDVAQEALFTAWRSLDQLRAPDRFS